MAEETGRMSFDELYFEYKTNIRQLHESGRVKEMREEPRDEISGRGHLVNLVACTRYHLSLSEKNISP